MSNPFKHLVMNGNGRVLLIARGQQQATMTKLTTSKTTSQALQISWSIQ